MQNINILGRLMKDISVLEKANFSNAYNDEIYRMGVIWQ